MDIRQAFKTRRSIYDLKPEIPFSEERLVELIEGAVLHTPSPFNCQCQRAVLALGDAHKGFWADLEGILKGIVPAASFEKNTQPKIESFARGYGTILYYDDTAVTESLAAQFPAYAANFPVWAQHCNAMLQYAVWSLLASEGIGASLQHYAPLVDEKAAKRFAIPSTWKLVAQMPFGAPGSPPDAKTFQPLSDRFKIER